MKKFSVLTIFPKIIATWFENRIITRAVEQKLLALDILDLRDFALDKHRRIDDVPYGGGAGMIMKPEPLVAAIESVQAQNPPPANLRRIYLTPKGQPWSQRQAERLLAYDHLLLLCGRYQGVDQRVIDGWIDEEISIGPYIVAGGEVAATVVLESMMRLLPGVLGNEASRLQETHSNDLPEYPQYTRPRDFRNRLVPTVLLEGDHEKIASWRSQAAHRLSKKDV